MVHRTEPSAEEARRSARVAARFFVAIDGVDATLVARRGDISASGIFFETEEAVGDVGSVQWLHIESSNREREIRLMAHVIRSVTLDDAKGRACGVAFEFMPESLDAAAAVERFVQYVLLTMESEPRADPHLSPRLPAQLRVASRSDDSALVRQLSVRSMTLEASWTVAVGEHIRVEITAPGMTRRTRLEGRAVRVIPTGRSAAAPGYEIEVEFQYEVARPPRHESSMTFAAVRPEAIAAASGVANVDAADDDDMSSVLDNLFSALIHPTPSGPRPERRHLSGMLSRIRLPTLCALLDMERLTGRLTLEREGERLVVHVRDGRIVDVEVERGGEASRSPRALLTRLFSWTDGSFELDVVPVDRVDRLGLTMTALLLDLARESDEEKHRGAGA